MKIKNETLFARLRGRPKRYFNCIFEVGDQVRLSDVRDLLSAALEMNDGYAVSKMSVEITKLLNSIVINYVVDPITVGCAADADKQEVFQMVAEEDDHFGYKLYKPDDAAMFSEMKSLICKVLAEKPNGGFTIETPEMANWLNSLNEIGGIFCGKLRHNEIRTFEQKALDEAYNIVNAKD